MEGFSIYFVLLGVLAVLVLFGSVIRKFLKAKFDIDVSDEQMDAVTQAVAEAVAQVEEIQKDLIAAGNEPMRDEDKMAVTTDLARELAIAAGVSKIKVDIALKIINAASTNSWGEV
jgi:hypothetical protein